MPTSTMQVGPIMDVWQNNLDIEMAKIRGIVHQYPYVAMDTEFPGVVARPIGDFKSSTEYQYQLLRCNVDLLKIIQVGMTFMDENGRSPSPVATWQFNFKFNLAEDMYAQDSIDLLTNCGIQFTRHDEFGLDVQQFAELLMTSGVVLTDEVRWISFHSGYDFGYMIKLLTSQPLPTEEHEFFELVKIFFSKHLRCQIPDEELQESEGRTAGGRRPTRGGTSGTSAPGRQ